MKVRLLANQRSGTGRAGRLASDLSTQLEAAGYEVDLLDPAEAARVAAENANGHAGTGTNGHAGEWPPDAVVSIGGDGTIFHALPELIRDQTPIYHIPGGNENLFAREFGMNREPTRLLRALANPSHQSVDVGQVDGTPFAIMVSVGPDAGVIHRLHAARTRSIGHAMYIRPTIFEGLRPHLPRLSVKVDGETLIENRRGFVIVANSRQYALRLDPAHRADMRDGELDVVFFPASNTVSALGWIGRCMVRARTSPWGPARARGTDIEVTSGSRAPWQVDGEAGGWLEPNRVLRFGIQPDALQVLRP